MVSADSFHSSQKLSLLNDIDKLRSLGVNQFVDLPQLIVCGDQSSGKSSVLEAISGIPFPTKDSLCTRFATEVILRNSVETSLKVSIVPDPEKNAEQRKAISTFEHSLSSFEDFAKLVDAAHEHMAEVTGQQAFYKDVLQLRVSGPGQPHLTIVDLPGLIHSENKQQSLFDVKTVKHMVSQYIQKPRSVVLAVVSAKNDVANQVVLSLARGFDHKGERTMGIITKPDELPPGSESESDFISLAENQNIHFQLGWHVLRNRGYKEKDYTREQRDESERTFFESGEWRKLPRDMVGIDSLKPKLSEVLFDQIKRQLPDLIHDIQNQVGSCERIIQRLGPGRETQEQQRSFLLEMSQDFQRIVRAAIDGSYEHSFFSEADTSIVTTKRLRAAIQNQNLAFAATMRREGQDRKIIKDDDASEHDIPTVKRSQLIDEICELLKENRGRELPGMFNPLIVGDLFHRQSRPWKKMVENHVLDVCSAVKSFLESVTENLSNAQTSEALLVQVLDPEIDTRQQVMLKKVDEILQPYMQGHPITYNHYFTETVQKLRDERRRAEATKTLGYNPETTKLKLDQEELRRLFTSLTTKTEVDMDRYASTEILDCMESFYQVALKSVVDNIAIYAIEQSLILDLDTLFSPVSIFRMDDEMVRTLSAEPPQNAFRREQTARKLDTLQKGLATIRVHAARRAQASGKATKSLPVDEESAKIPQHDAKTNQESQARKSPEPWGEVLNEP